MEFVRLCMKAEAEARNTGKKAIFFWRGYRGVMAANLPTATVPGMEVRLLNALNKISMKSVQETLVIINSFMCPRMYVISKAINSMFGDGS